MTGDVELIKAAKPKQSKATSEDARKAIASALAWAVKDSAAGNMDMSLAYMDGNPELSFIEETLNVTVAAILCEMGLDDDDNNQLTPIAEQVNLFILRNHDTGDNFITDTGNPFCNLGFP